MAGQLFDPDRANAAADLAVAVVGENADEAWLRMALSVVRALAEQSVGAVSFTFTTDDVWAALDEIPEVATGEPRAMGAVMRQAAKLGWVRATSHYRKSTRVACHARPLRVWVGDRP